MGEISQSSIDEVRALREHDENLIRLADLRDQVIEDIARITDSHHSQSGFYRINCASELLEYFKNNKERLNEL